MIRFFSCKITIDLKAIGVSARAVGKFLEDNPPDRTLLAQGTENGLDNPDQQPEVISRLYALYKQFVYASRNIYSKVTSRS